MQESKELSMKTESSILRTAFTYHAYNFVLDVANGVFTPDLTMRLAEIGKYISRNMTKEAQYLAELIIRDYGTHVITRAKVGAELAREDYVDKSSMQKSEKTLNAVRAGASFGFKDTAKMSAKAERKHEEESRQEYTNSLHQSRIKSKGALNAIKLAQKVQEAKDRRDAGLPTEVPTPHEKEQRFWTDPSTGRQIRISKPRSLDPSSQNEEEVVSLDQSGDPLYQMINKYTVPGLDGDIADKVAFLIREAYKYYGKMNTYKGCMDPSKKDFDPNVNQEGSCNPESDTHRYRLGGFFQVTKDYFKREPAGQHDNLVNGITGSFSCPPKPYVHNFLARTGEADPNDPVQKHKVTVLLVCEATDADLIEKNEKRIGYMFGGAFSDNHVNPFTGDVRCPGSFLGIKVLAGITVCVSRNYDMDSRFAMDYGGFTSCQTEQQTCPQGFTNYLIGMYYSMGMSMHDYEEQMDDGCELYVCIKPSQIKEFKLQNIKLPPFTDITCDTASCGTKPGKSFLAAAQEGKESSKLPETTEKVTLMQRQQRTKRTTTLGDIL